MLTMTVQIARQKWYITNPALSAEINFVALEQPPLTWHTSIRSKMHTHTRQHTDKTSIRIYSNKHKHTYTFKHAQKAKTTEKKRNELAISFFFTCLILSREISALDNCRHNEWGQKRLTLSSTMKHTTNLVHKDYESLFALDIHARTSVLIEHQYTHRCGGRVRERTTEWERETHTQRRNERVREKKR